MRRMARKGNNMKLKPETISRLAAARKIETAQRTAYLIERLQEKAIAEGPCSIYAEMLAECRERAAECGHTYNGEPVWERGEA